MGNISRLKKQLLNKKPSLPVIQETFRTVVTGNIYKLMAQKEISKTDLAERIGISKAAMTAMLSGERNLELNTVSKIAYFLGYRPNLIFEEAGKVGCRPLYYYREEERGIQITTNNEGKLELYQEYYKTKSLCAYGAPQ